MNRSIEELKIRAKKLQKRAVAGEEAACAFLKLSPEKAADVQRKTCLNRIAFALGFKDWSHASQVLSGDKGQSLDQGKIWYSGRCVTLLNHWFADYEGAKAFHADNPELYLLPYKTQYMVVEKEFIETLEILEGLDDQWQAVRRDLVASYGSNAWRNIVGLRIDQIPAP